MAAKPQQTYETHIRNDKLLFVYLGLLLAVLVCAGVGFFAWPKVFFGLGLVLNTVATILLAGNTRGYGTKVQDRVVRLEMRLRLEKLLDGDMAGRIGEFSLRQLVGLRFASDEELPALAKKTLDDKLEKADDIKKLVRDWQPDTLRV